MFSVFHQFLYFPVNFPAQEVNLTVSQLLSGLILNLTFVLAFSNFISMSLCIVMLLFVLASVLFACVSQRLLIFRFLSQMSLGDLLFLGMVNQVLLLLWDYDCCYYCF